jgi:alkyl sulfatase BDS1-like metallo-beta-lactamase superfamily hydrolase
MQYGLFKVTDRIYQVRGFDLSNITFVQGDTGWIVFDPLISTETAKAAYDFVTSKLGKRPVLAVVYSHSHVDHYGGVRGIVDEADVTAGKVKIIAPEHFTEHAVSENVIAGNVMGRRAIYMYGALLPRDERGGVNGGLGQTTSTGTVTLIVPSDEVKKTGTEITVDGVKMVFQMTPGTEAPAEMNTYFPQFKAMWMAENSTNTMHNILTLRGAQVRDALKWASYLNETRPVRARGRGQVPESSLAEVGQPDGHRLLEEATRHVQVHARPDGQPHEQGLYRLRDRRDDPAAAGA